MVYRRGRRAVVYRQGRRGVVYRRGRRGVVYRRGRRGVVYRQGRRGVVYRRGRRGVVYRQGRRGVVYRLAISFSWLQDNDIGDNHTKQQVVSLGLQPVHIREALRRHNTATGPLIPCAVSVVTSSHA